MNKKTLILVLLFSIIFIILLALLVISILSGFLPYHLLAFSSSCAEKCSEVKFVSSECVMFPSLYKADESPCGNNGVSIGMTKDCRNQPRFGGSKNCCCYK